MIENKLHQEMALKEQSSKLAAVSEYDISILILGAYSYDTYIYLFTKELSSLSETGRRLQSHIDKSATEKNEIYLALVRLEGKCNTTLS